MTTHRFSVCSALTLTAFFAVCSFHLGLAQEMQSRAGFTNLLVETAHFGVVGLHHGFGRRTELDRIDKTVSCMGCSVSCPECAPPSTSGWFEGFGSGFDQQKATENGVGAGDGHFSGLSFGFQRNQRGAVFGIFGSWANHRVNGQGQSDGDWGLLGLFGRIDHRYGFLEGSIAYGGGKYKFRSSALDTFLRSSSGDPQGFSFRLAGGQDFWVVGGWTMGPRAELSMSYLDHNRFLERGRADTDLAFSSYETTYLEGGIGLHASKSVLIGQNRITATGKMMGMYGGVNGGDLFDRFTDERIKISKTSTAWFVPEATLAWNLAPGIVMACSYFGRFGEKYSENSGALSLNLFW